MDAKRRSGGGMTGVHVAVEAGREVTEDKTAEWALGRLRDVLMGSGPRTTGARAHEGHRLRVQARWAHSREATALPWGDLPMPHGAESFAVLRVDDGLAVVGSDGRGLAYGILELADIAAHAEDPVAALRAVRPSSHRPATPIRSISRLFVSDVQDKQWFHDRAFWDDYLTELATHRINRLQLGLGMQYNYSHDPQVRDNYLCFAYPFLLDVPGYDVRAGNVPDAERDHNLHALRYISDEAKRRGIHFQLGLWNHAYEMPESPNPLYPIQGLTAENHAPYCAAALTRLLEACPSIDGLTLRVHYEGGVPEPGHEFWRTVMDGVRAVDRRIEIDMHAKGVDQGLVEVAQRTGAPVVISAKYWAEHQGLPYHQASIREKEKATAHPGTGLRAITKHQRRFTRYGYGDFLHEDRDFDVIFRIWPGTQRLLLWGDPVLTAGYGRLGTVGGALGVELCEPLSFRGRHTSGEPGGRDPYLDGDLQLGPSDWRKYAYTYRLWGRLLYDPEADPASWRRYLHSEFGPAAESVESALSAASRILPLVTVVHGVGASNNGYWPEMYLNMPIANGALSDHYASDTAEPATFGGVSSFDPMLFDGINDHADDVLAGRRTGRYTPSETADWLERLAERAEDALDRARRQAPNGNAPQFRRVAIDIEILTGLGRFFANKSRAGLSYALYERLHDLSHLGAAVDSYELARDAFARVADLATGVYKPDLTFGTRPSEHGHWADRLPAIAEDLAALKEEYARALREGRSAARTVPGVPLVPRPVMRHQAPSTLRRAEDLPVTVALDDEFEGGVVLHYRHLHQGAEYQSVEMAPDERGDHAAVIPGSYTDSSYPLLYFFTVQHVTGDAWLEPGLDETLTNQPYHIVRIMSDTNGSRPLARQP